MAIGTEVLKGNRPGTGAVGALVADDADDRAHDAQAAGKGTKNDMNRVKTTIPGKFKQKWHQHEPKPVIAPVVAPPLPAMPPKPTNTSIPWVGDHPAVREALERYQSVAVQLEAADREYADAVSVLGLAEGFSASDAEQVAINRIAKGESTDPVDQLAVISKRCERLRLAAHTAAKDCFPVVESAKVEIAAQVLPAVLAPSRTHLAKLWAELIRENRKYIWAIRMVQNAGLSSGEYVPIFTRHAVSHGPTGRPIFGDTTCYLDGVSSQAALQELVRKGVLAQEDIAGIGF